MTSIPTDTKKRTANASRNGSRSAPTWWLNGDSPTTTPATNAPSASETPKAAADISAVPSATVSATRMKSSRDRVRTTRCSSQGTTRLPTASISPTKSSALPIAHAAVARSALGAASGDDRQQHEDHDRGDVLEYEPADCDAPVWRLCSSKTVEESARLPSGATTIGPGAGNRWKCRGGV